MINDMQVLISMCNILSKPNSFGNLSRGHKRKHARESILNLGPKGQVEMSFKNIFKYLALVAILLRQHFISVCTVG